MRPPQAPPSDRQPPSLDLDDLLAKLDRLSGQAPERQVFYNELLGALVALLDGEDACLWVHRLGRLRCEASIDGEHPALDPALLSRLEDARCADRPTLIPTGRAGLTGAMLVCPVRGSFGPLGVIACRVRPAIDDSLGQEMLSIGVALAEIADQFELRHEVRSMAVSSKRHKQLEGFLLSVHRAGAADAIARELAEEGRRLLECDRLSVLVRSGASWRIAAVSGAQKPSRRSDAVARMEKLARTVLRPRDPEPLDTSDADLAPQLRDAADAYLESTSARHVLLTPCPRPPEDPDETAPTRARRPDLALLAEQFEGTLPGDAPQLLETVKDHAAVALERARRTGLAGTLRRTAAGWTWRRGAVRLVVAAITTTTLAVAAGCLIWMPANLTLSAAGRLVPSERARVFAPMDANVQDVLVAHSDKVEKGQPLLRLDSLELRIDLQQAKASLATTKKEISALQTARLRAGLPGAANREELAGITAKLEALKQQTGFQAERIRLLQEQQQRLVVRSPLAGEVISWRPEDYLADRPVRRGQRMLEIAATDGAWNLDIELPDRQAGHLLSAAESSDVLYVEFVVRSDPSTTHVGRVTKVARATQADSDGAAVLRIEAAPHDSAALAPRSGMTIAAKIHCGKRSLGYVWFHETLEVLQRRFF